MKKMIMVLLSGIISFGAIQAIPASTVRADPVITGGPKLAVLVDGRKIKFQGGEPVSENGRVQVPLRGVGEALGAEVGFTGQTVTYKKGDKTIVLTLGSEVATVDGKKVNMDTKAKAVKGRTYVPLRFVSENLGEAVSWDQVGNWVWIGSREVPTLDDIGVKPQQVNEFRKLIDPINALYEGKENAYVFSKVQLPVQIGDRIIYDLWTVQKNGEVGLQVRYSKGAAFLYFLFENAPGARVRYQDRNLKVKNADGTFTLTYKVDSDTDWELIGGEKGYAFKLKQADYIGIEGPSPTSIFFIKDAFK